MVQFKSIDANTAKKWLDADEALLVDVREPEEFAVCHIPGAILIPLGGIDVSKLPALNHKKLIIQCQLGKRGGMACEKLLAVAPDLEVYNLEGGIVAWQQAGFEAIN